MQRMNARGDLAVIVLAMAVLGGCDNLSNVGDESSGQPAATATVVNYGAGDSATGDVTVDVRAQAEVLLTGKDSIESDKPILSYLWEPQNADVCPALLTVRNLTTVNVTLPAATEPLDCVFKLTVQDSNGENDTATATLRVQPVLDTDRFLTFKSGTPRIRVVVATTTASDLTKNADFTLTGRYEVTYKTRAGSFHTIGKPPEEQRLDLGVPITGAWSADGSGGNSEVDYRNPVVDLPLPSVNLDQITRRYQTQNRVPGDRLPDPASVDEATVTVFLTLTSNTVQNLGKIFVLDAQGAVVRALANDGNGLATELVLSDDEVDELRVRGGGLENRQTAQSYYDAIDKDGVKSTLREWLTQNCLDPDASDYGADAHAVYTNNYDLGFGRDMYFRTARPAGCTSSTFGQADAASVVINYPTLEAAGKKLNPVIAVAMEYKAFDALRSQPGNATFYAFTPDEATGEFRRVLSANFDGRGEKYVPGSCTVCHAGRPLEAAPLIGTGSEQAGSTTYAASDGNVGATFMPWDLESFLFWDTDPAIRRDSDYLKLPANAALAGSYTRAAQEAEFRKLNIAAMSTYGQGNPSDPSFVPYNNSDNGNFAGPAELVSLWYGGASLPDATFHNRVVAAGWKNSLAGNPPDAETIYLDVVARQCRACHTQRVSAGPQFLQWQELRTLSAEVRQQVFDSGAMPGARLSDDRLWVPANGVVPGDLLAAHFGAADLGGEVPQAPGQPVAAFDITVLNPGETQYSSTSAGVTVERGGQIRLEGSTSLYPKFFRYTLAAPAGSAATLVSDAQPIAAFRPDRPGDYQLDLTVADAGDRRLATQTITVQNGPPQLGASESYSILSSGTLAVTDPAIGLLAGATDPEGDSLTATSDPAVCATAGSVGTPVVATDGTFSFVHDGGPANESGQFGVRISDEFGASVVRCVIIGIIDPIDTTPPGAPTGLVATAVDGATGSSRTFPIQITWTAPPDPDVVLYRIFRRAGSGPLVELASVSATSFSDNTANPSTSYEYGVRAEDAKPNASALSATASATTKSSYSLNVAPVISSNCSGCHAFNYSLVRARVNISSPLTGNIPCKPNVSNGCSHSPGDKLTNTQFNTLVKWIGEGARNN